ncbi:PLDc N-terminal domain-containing protein [Cloacibacterium sp.]|uniref:PLDc N-terminal domain-containing protein n=1 Tax=Cloacibacterium sp. TaxID=1913682 RepID=UPI0039E3F98B
MNLTKTQKTFVGILHFAPIIGIFLYMVAFFGFFLTTIPEMEKHNGEPPVEFFAGFASIFIILAITILAGFATLIFDIIHLVKSNKNDTNNKILMWVLILLFAQGIGGIIYFFLEILPDKKNNTIQDNAINQ